MLVNVVDQKDSTYYLSSPRSEEGRELSQEHFRLKENRLMGDYAIFDVGGVELASEPKEQFYIFLLLMMLKKLTGPSKKKGLILLHKLETASGEGEQPSSLPLMAFC